MKIMEGLIEMSKEQAKAGWAMGRILKNLNSIKTAESDAERESIAEEIKKAVDELEGIRCYFDAVADPELVDYAIYREKAALTRLSYLLRKAKYISNDAGKTINI